MGTNINKKVRFSCFFQQQKIKLLSLFLKNLSKFYHIKSFYLDRERVTHKLIKKIGDRIGSYGFLGSQVAKEHGQLSPDV